MAYSVHTGLNTPLVSLTLFSPQPICEGLLYTRTTALGDRSVWNEGPYLPFVWTVLKNVAQYQAILTLCGLASVDLALVTVSGPDDRFNIVRYNATVTLPLDVRRQNFRLRNLSLIFSDLVQI